MAIVGARQASAAGVAFAHRLAAGLARAGVAVVSGLARGIDGAAHAGALEAGGRTVAVLGCGIDVDYPRANAALAARVATAGAIVSEYGPGTPPAPWRFPARNRIVAALGQSVVVVEAARTQRRADHGRLRARDRPRGAGGAGIAVGGRGRGRQRACCATAPASSRAPATCSSRSGIDPAAAAGEEREAVSPEADAAAASRSAAHRARRRRSARGWR